MVISQCFVNVIEMNGGDVTSRDEGASFAVRWIQMKNLVENFYSSVT